MWQLHPIAAVRVAINYFVHCLKSMLEISFDKASSFDDEETFKANKACVASAGARSCH